MDEDIVSLSDLKRCTNALVSVETASGDIYQGKVETVYDDMNTLVLLRPFKTGRPMTPLKFPLYINPEDIVKIVEPAPQKAPASNANSKSSNSQRQSKQKQPDVTQNFCEELQSLTVTTKTPQKTQTYTALELLSRAQANKPQIIQATVNIPVPNGISLLQRPQNSAKQSNGGGPSGNPIMDLLSGHARKGNHAFAQPIDPDELKKDFDFTANLDLFNKDDENEFDTDDLDDFQELDGEDYRVVYEDKTAPNYRHDENIISDPKRVTSWVDKAAAKTKSFTQNQRPSPMNNNLNSVDNKKQKLLQSIPTSVVSNSTPIKGRKQQTVEKTCTSVSTEDNNGSVDEYNSLKLKSCSVLPTDNGALLPVLKKAEKQNLLEATFRMYNEHIYNIILADRFTEYVFDFQKRYSTQDKEMLIIAGANCNPIVLHRFMQYFYNRGCKLHVFDPPTIPGQLENKAQVYRDVTDLPTNFSAIYMLCAQTFHSDEELRRWILRLARPSQMNPNNSNSHNQKTPPNKLHYPRIVALDFRLFDVKYMHTLYMGAVDDTAISPGRIRHNSNDSVICTFEAFVADLGTPYTWISNAEATPIAAFRNSLTCRLIVT